MCNFQSIEMTIHTYAYFLFFIYFPSLMDLLCYTGVHSYFNLAEAINGIFYYYIYALMP